MNNAQITCKNTRPRNKCGDRQGFTLLEMSIVITIIAVVLGSGMVIFASSLQKKQLEETNAKLATIQKALLDYRRAFNRIPCPANINAYSATESNFGKESSNATDGRCYGTPGSDYYHSISGTCTNAGSHCIHGGLVPTKVLRLPDDYAFDGWGRRIFYAVDSEFVVTDAFLSGTTTADITYDTLLDASPPYERIKILYAAASYKTQSAAYVLVSHGPNGHGAYPRFGHADTRISTNSINTYELENCDCDNAGDDGTFDDEFYQLSYQPDTSDPQNVFDDVVVYATRADLPAGTE